jgi:predicted transglutaminase-like cysteine proteinase
MRGLQWISVAAALVISALTSSHANAMAFNFQLKTYFAQQAQFYVAEGGIQVGPLGHAVFCAKNKVDCDVSASSHGNYLVTAETKLLQLVNADVNSHMKPRADSRSVSFGDTWTIGGSYGDCEDYALTKMNALIQRGLPAAAMRIAVVKTHAGEPHALLVARTLQGDVVLDNINHKIVAWDKANYQWLMIQSSQNLRQWRKVNVVSKAGVASIS